MSRISSPPVARVRIRTADKLELIPRALRLKFDAIHPDLFLLFGELHLQRIDQHRCRITFMYNVGTALAHPVVTEEAAGLIIKHLGIPLDSVLPCRRLAAAYPDPQDLAQLTDRVDALGRPLSWAHLKYLLLPDLDFCREELIERTLAQGWSKRDLLREILRLRARGSTPRPPRTLPRPRTMRGATVLWLNLNDQWLRRAQDVFDPVRLSELPEDPETTTGVEGDLETIAEQLLAMMTQVASLQNDLIKLRQKRAANPG